MLQVGLAQYTLRLYDAAEATFEAAREQDPYRLAHMDTYSNILYVKVCSIKADKNTYGCCSSGFTDRFFVCFRFCRRRGRSCRGWLTP